MVPPDIQPMLATTGVPRNLDGWAAEPKLDGWRARVLVDGADVMVRTRRGRPVTEHVPVAANLTGLRAVLDGELVAGAGVAEDFYKLGPWMAARRGVKPSFVAFDVLWADGELLTSMPYSERRRRLEELDLPQLGVPLVPTFDGVDAADLFRACSSLGVEGLVLKQQASTYQPGVRSTSWRKVKCSAWRAHLERRLQRRG